MFLATSEDDKMCSVHEYCGESLGCYIPFRFLALQMNVSEV